jgi:hypothetical protein
MLRQARSGTATPNRGFIEFPRTDSEGNVQWAARAANDMSQAETMSAGSPEAWTYIALLGGSDTVSFRLRVAQSHLRRDMLPSYWSDALLIELKRASYGGARATHVPLSQPSGTAFPSRQNGVVSRPLSDFDNAKSFPNIALISLPISEAEIVKRVEDFKRARSTLDALEHVLRWLAFAWGVARTANPLHENYGIPSACMLETVFAAANFDLTPGLESRASCPEAIWSAAKFWHEYFEKTIGKVPFGRFCHPHRYPIEEPPSTDGPPAAVKGRPAKKR